MSPPSSLIGETSHINFMLDRLVGYWINICSFFSFLNSLLLLSLDSPSYWILVILARPDHSAYFACSLIYSWVPLLLLLLLLLLLHYYTATAVLRDTRCCLLRFLCRLLSPVNCQVPSSLSNILPLARSTSDLRHRHRHRQKKRGKVNRQKKNAMYTACLQYMLPFTAAGHFNPSLI